MTKKERIAELERRVAELETRQVWTGSAWATCSLCGTRYTGIHSCWTAPYTTTGVSTDTSKLRNTCAAPRYFPNTYTGAAS